MDFTCFIAMVCEVLSSATRVICEGELAVMVPVSRLPSRIVTVACGASVEGVPLFAQDARKPEITSTGIERANKRGMWSSGPRYNDPQKCYRPSPGHPSPLRCGKRLNKCFLIEFSQKVV